MWKHPIPRQRRRIYRLSDQPAAQPAATGTSSSPAEAGQTAYRTERIKQMNMAKVKQRKPQLRTIAFTTMWLVLLGAAMAFIAIAGHV